MEAHVRERTRSQILQANVSTLASASFAERKFIFRLQPQLIRTPLPFHDPPFNFWSSARWRATNATAKPSTELWIKPTTFSDTQHFPKIFIPGSPTLVPRSFLDYCEIDNPTEFSVMFSRFPSSRIVSTRVRCRSKVSGYSLSLTKLIIVVFGIIIYILNLFYHRTYSNYISDFCCTVKERLVW